MSSADSACKEATLPIVSITIGSLLLFFSLFFLLAYHLLPLTPETNSAIPTITTLLLLTLGGIYLLACLAPHRRWRIWQQRSSATLLIMGSTLLLYWERTGYGPEGITLSPANTLLALFLLGLAALLQSTVRNLTHIAIVFLLILSATALAIFGIIAQLLGFDPIFPWYGVHHMSMLSAAGLLMFASGLAYMTWWCHRNNHHDAVSGITVLVAILLLFTMLLGSGLIYIVSATHLHHESRELISSLLRERASRIESLLREAEIHANIISYEALQHEANLWTQGYAKRLALRITDSRGRIVQSHNGEWFDRKSIATIDGTSSQLWRDEEGLCQLRVKEQRDGYQIEVGITLDLLPILDNPMGSDGRETLKLCAQRLDGSLHCLAPGQNRINQLPPLGQQGHTDIANIDGGYIFLRDDNIQAVLPLPRYGLLVIMEQNQQAIFESFHKELSTTVPLALLLLGASIVLIAWRIHPLIRTLQRNEEKYRSLVDGAGDAIFMHAPDRKFIEANPAASQLLGYSHDELIGRHPDDFLLPEDQEDARSALAQSRTNGTPISARRQLRRKDGSKIPVEIRARILDSGELISVVRDISLQTNFEEELLQKERFIRSVVEVLAEGVVVYDNDGAIIYSNRAALRILGQDSTLVDKRVTSYDPRWAVIQNDGTPLPPSEQPAMISLRQGLSKRNVIMGVMRPDEERVWISANSDPLWNHERDTIIGAVASFSDISQKRAMEQEVYASRERLRALSSHLLHVREEEKAQIARDIHDELGSNLTAIKMGIEWLNEKFPGEYPDVRRRLQQLSKVTSQAIITSRRMVTQLRPTVLEDLGLWAALEWLLRDFQQHNDSITVSSALHANHLVLPPQISLQLYRVIQEALTNISKHAKAHKVHLECWEAEGKLHVSLEDDGIGITEDSAYKIDSYGIRGMYERIGQLRGTLQILGAAGEGTLIAISLPLEQQKQEHGDD